jgi:hypothetical protein
MPRLPIITAQEAVLRRIPGEGASPEQFGAGFAALAQMAGTSQKISEKVLANQIALQKAQQEAEDTVEAMRLRTQFGTAFADLDLNLRNNYDYKTHAETLQTQGQDLLERMAGSAANPEVSRKFRLDATRVLGEKVITAKYESRKYVSGVADAENSKFLAELAVEVANIPDTPQMRPYRAYLMEYAERHTNEVGAQGHITPEQAGERMKAFHESIDTVAARRAMRADPDQFLVDLEDTRNWPKLSATRRQQLDEQGVRVAELKAKNQDRINKEYSGALKKHLIDRMDGGTNADAEIRALRNSLTDEDYEHLLARNEKKFKLGPDKSDQETYTRLELGIRTGTITSFKEIDAVKHLLTMSHYSHFTGLLDARLSKAREDAEGKGEKIRDRQIASGTKFLSSIFQTKSIMDFDAEANAATALAVAEFEQRASRERDKDPGLLQTEVFAKYAKMLKDIIERPRDPVRQMLRYRSDQALKDAYARKEITLDEFHAQKRLLEYYLFLSNAAGEKPFEGLGPKPAQGPATAPPSAPSRPSGGGRKPIGGSTWFGR